MSELPTKDPAIKFDPERDELVVELNKLQPKIHKKLTANVKQKQLEYILAQTDAIFGKS